MPFTRLTPPTHLTSRDLKRADQLLAVEFVKYTNAAAYLLVYMYLCSRDPPLTLQNKTSGTHALQKP